jgi:hypothetical protein
LLDTTLGLFVVGNVAAGFVRKVGSDAWDAVKSGLKKLTRSGPEGQLFAFHFSAEHETGRIAVETILTDPKPNDVERFLTSDLPRLYQTLKPVLETEGLWKLVLESKKGELKILYGVRSDAVPVKFATNKLKMPTDS